MHAKFGTSYHWIPELFCRMKLPVFDGVVEALEKNNAQRKRALAKAKTTPVKRRRIALKKKRVREGMERMKWTKKHGRDTYGDAGSESEHEVAKAGSGIIRGKSVKKGNSHRNKECAACGSSKHQRSSHKDCPFNKKSMLLPVQWQKALSLMMRCLLVVTPCQI